MGARRSLWWRAPVSEEADLVANQKFVELGSQYRVLKLASGSIAMYGIPEVAVTQSDLLRAGGSSGYADTRPRARCGLDAWRENWAKQIGSMPW